MQDHEHAGKQVVLQMAGHHSMLIDQSSDGQLVRFVTSEGAMPITVEVTSQGITLKLNAPTITLDTTGTLNLTADKLLLGGRQGIEIASGGALALSANGELSSVAGAQLIRAEQGCVAVKASDDVKLSGERVMVNCDETNEHYYRQPPTIPPTPELGPANKTD